jgi:hypothetical protein
VKVVVEMSLQGDNGIGMGSTKTHETVDLSIEEWTGGNRVSSEEYILVKDADTQEHLFKIRMGSRKQVYIEMNNGSILTVRDSGQEPEGE